MPYATTNLPDGTRDVYQLGPDEPATDCAWAVAVTGNPQLGHIAGPGWTVHRLVPTIDYARQEIQTLERICAVEYALALPVDLSEEGPAWTALGFWDEDEIQLVGVVPGQLQATGGEDVSVGGAWTDSVRAPDEHAAVVAAYRLIDQYEAELQEVAPGQEPLPGVR